VLESIISCFAVGLNLALWRRWPDRISASIYSTPNTPTWGFTLAGGNYPSLNALNEGLRFDLRAVALMA